MIVEKCKIDDFEAIKRNISHAILFMRSYGNLEQWNNLDSLLKDIEYDIYLGRYYKIVEGDEIVGSFMFSKDLEPTYEVIEGKWNNDSPYGVIHRICSSGDKKGILKVALDYCFELIDNIRIDTHKDNLPMRHLLEKYKFHECGIITLKNKQKRIAYQSERNIYYGK